MMQRYCGSTNVRVNISCEYQPFSWLAAESFMLRGYVTNTVYESKMDYVEDDGETPQKRKTKRKKVQRVVAVHEIHWSETQFASKVPQISTELLVKGTITCLYYILGLCSCRFGAVCKIEGERETEQESDVPSDMRIQTGG
jgi:hypothetical protein